MKKRLLVLMMVLAIGTSGVFAAGSGKSFAIGAQTGWPLGGALTFKVEALPCVFAADYHVGTNGAHLGATADWWIANPTITGPWGYYYGVGVYAGVYFGSNADGDTFGVAAAPRALVGTNVVLLDDFLEIFLQVGWQPTFYFGSNSRNSSWFDFDPWCIPANLGFRFWF